jgi:hypothetical protein
LQHFGEITIRKPILFFGEAAMLVAPHNPSSKQGLDERLQFVGDGAYRIKRRPLLEMNAV